ncbi:MAG TPA: hypothetical protein VFI17_04135 [Solirubrobacterales bacterium]|nr:hypothetical protein [Solirubrobacterales bacterium]
MPLEADFGIARFGAEVLAVDQEPLLAAFEAQGELRHRGVGGGGEGGADAAVLGGDEANEGDVELAVEVDDDVGELALAAVGEALGLAL